MIVNHALLLAHEFFACGAEAEEVASAAVHGGFDGEIGGFGRRDDAQHRVVYRSFARRGREQFAGKMDFDVRFEEVQRDAQFGVRESRQEFADGERVRLHLQFVVLGRSAQRDAK